MVPTDNPTAFAIVSSAFSSLHIERISSSCPEVTASPQLFEPLATSTSRTKYSLIANLFANPLIDVPDSY